jgi:hypothetical protein
MAKTKARRVRQRSDRTAPKRIIQIAAATSSETETALFALTDEGEVYEYGYYKEKGLFVGMWEALSSLSAVNIVGNAGNAGDDGDDEDDEDEDEED